MRTTRCEVKRRRNRIVTTPDDPHVVLRRTEERFADKRRCDGAAREGRRHLGVRDLEELDLREVGAIDAQPFAHPSFGDRFERNQRDRRTFEIFRALHRPAFCDAQREDRCVRRVQSAAGKERERESTVRGVGDLDHVGKSGLERAAGHRRGDRAAVRQRAHLDVLVSPAFGKDSGRRARGTARCRDRSPIHPVATARSARAPALRRTLVRPRAARAPARG